MSPTQPIRNGQSAIPAEISIPGFTLATYSRLTDPASAPRSIKHQPRIPSSGYKRKINTPSLDDAKRPKPECISTSSRDVPARKSRSPSLPVNVPRAVDSRFTNDPLIDINDNNRSNADTPPGTRSQTPIQIPRTPSLPVGSRSATPLVTAIAPAYAAIANLTASGPGNHPVERMEPFPIMNVPESDNPAEAALLAIFGGKKRPSIAAPPPPVQLRVIPTPPQNSVTADMGSSTAMIEDPPEKKAITNLWIQEQQTSSVDQVPVTNPSQSSTSWYRSHTGVQTPPLTPATPAPTFGSAFADVTGVAATATTISKVPSTELDDIAKHTPEPELDVPPIPLVAIATLQSVSADLFMVLGRGDISNNENQLFAAAGKMSACLQAHFVPHMDVWRTEAMRPKAAMVIVPKRDEMVSMAIQTSNIAETEADDMSSKAIQTIVTMEPEPEPEPSALQRISFAIPQPESTSLHYIHHETADGSSDCAYCEDTRCFEIFPRYSPFA